VAHEKRVRSNPYRTGLKKKKSVQYGESLTRVNQNQRKGSRRADRLLNGKSEGGR